MNKTKIIAVNGLLTAMVVIILFLATTSPTTRFSFYVLSSFFISVVIIESGAKAGGLFYTVSSIISALILSNKLGVVPYVLFFGNYGLVSFYIDKLNKNSLKYILKLLYFNLAIFIVYFTFRNVFFSNIVPDIPLWMVYLLLQIVFIIYDYIYTLFIGYYNLKIRRYLRR